jgi:drug/metabolite transporter (DMT)-like permease
MLRALIYATIAAVGNALFVYGSRGSAEAKNPFIFMFGAVIVGTVLFSIAISFFDTHRNISFLLANWKFVLMTGCGFFISFLGFYLLYTGFGASSYILYAVISILTTSIGVGVFCYREPFNLYHTLSLLCALLTIVFFSYGQHISTLK